MKTINELMNALNTSGENKVSAKSSKLFILGIMAGMYIAFGAIFFTTVTAFGGHGGAVRLLGGVTFSLGIILVVLAGAELFTGNNLMIVSLLNKKIKFQELLKNWGIVYLGNFFGALLMVGLMILTKQYLQDDGAIGQRVLNIANIKVNLEFSTAFSRAILCNILVCLAIWVSMIAKSIPGKILGIVFPISGFVAIGYEHCVANMYFVPMGVAVKKWASPSFWNLTGLNPLEYSNLEFCNFLTQNLIPVTLGNLFGGVFFVGFLYWFIHKDEA
ncbi:MAG: formate transporter [Bacteriovoracaceae bacterium]|jgi:formate transporter